MSWAAAGDAAKGNGGRMKHQLYSASLCDREEGVCGSVSVESRVIVDRWLVLLPAGHVFARQLGVAEHTLTGRSDGSHS